MKKINTEYESLLTNNSLLQNLPGFLARICGTNLFKQIYQEKKHNKNEIFKKSKILCDFDFNPDKKKCICQIINIK